MSRKEEYTRVHLSTPCWCDTLFVLCCIVLYSVIPKAEYIRLGWWCFWLLLQAMDDRTIGHNPERLSLLKGGIVYCNTVT